MDDLRIADLGDTAFSVEFGEAVDRTASAKVMGLRHAIDDAHRAGNVTGLVELVPTFRSLLVSYDPLVTRRRTIQAEVMAVAAACSDAPVTAARSWRLPVCYDDDLGPDIDAVCRAAGLSRAEMIAVHTGTDYFVYMLGFMPGFAYMGDIPEPLRLPRRSTPRVKVPAGSVAVAGSLGAVYPWDSPGGWHLLGRTPVTFFDPARTPPSLLAPGDSVRFHAVERADYEAACRDPGRLAPEHLLAEGG